MSISPNYGRRTRNFVRLRADLRAARRPCWLCHQPIDYSLPPDHPDAFTVDHVKPRSTHPELAEDPANLQAAHASCNKSRGTRDAGDMGTTSRAW